MILFFRRQKNRRCYTPALYYLLMADMLEHLVDHMKHMLVVKAVINVFPILPAFDQARCLQISQLVGNRRLFHSHRLAQMSNAKLLAFQCKDDAQARFITEHFENRAHFFNLIRQNPSRCHCSFPWLCSASR